MSRSKWLVALGLLTIVLGLTSRLSAQGHTPNPTPVVVNLTPTLSGTPPAAAMVSRDTVYVSRTDTVFVDRPDPETPVRQAQPAPSVEIVERTLLDTGLFNAVRVVFEFDSAKLLPAAYPTLNVVAEVMQRNPDLRLTVEGHTDSVGPADYNLALSERRAESVQAYLEGRGIAAERLRAEGRGEASPVASNDDPTGRTLNRRVAFVVRAQ